MLLALSKAPALQGGALVGQFESGFKMESTYAARTARPSARPSFICGMVAVFGGGVVAYGRTKEGDNDDKKGS